MVYQHKAVAERAATNVVEADWKQKELPMARYEVVCITKRGGHYNPHERITHVGLNTQQGRMFFTQEQVIAWIEPSQHHSFYVMRAGRNVEVTVATRNGRKYLKTEADGLDPNNLLALPEC